MKLTVVIVNYNVQHFLEQCLLSVFNAQKNIPIEVYVVDNNSVDGSVSMVKEKFPEVKLIASKDNLGFSKGNNLAIKKALGEYVLLLNPDTLVEEDTFEKVVNFMDEHPDAGGLGVKMVDGKGVFLPESKRSLPTPTVAFYKIFGLSSLFPKSKRFGKYHLGHLDKDKNHEVEILSGAFMLLRKKALDEIGLLDEEFFMYGEDIDLSYRILKGGYKNYYFADTRIIHYKGESTKKSSVNYVFVFYNAMIIFAKKHFSSKNANLFSALINLAIYFRAGLAIISRFIKKSFYPILDYLILFGGTLGIKALWESTTKTDKFYPEEFSTYLIPIFACIWILFISINGGYKKNHQIVNTIRGSILGSISIFIIYGLLNEEYRYSRAIVALSSIWALLGPVAFRMIAKFAKTGSFSFNETDKKRIAIVGSFNEIERVKSILKETKLFPQFIGNVTPKLNSTEKGYLGNLSQLKEIIQIHKINEVIFCSKDVAANEIIDRMINSVKSDVEYKIAPPESLFIIGSNSINSPGELYIIDVNSLNKRSNAKSKRLFDIVSSFVLLCTTPFLIFFVKNPASLLKNIFNVLSGSKSWVGYSDNMNLRKDMPLLKKGILSPLDVFDSQNVSADVKEKANVQYVKDYHILNDLNILLRGLKRLDR